MKIRAVYWIIGLAVLFCGFWGGVDELCVKADQTQIDVWDGTSDTGWYDGNPTEGKVWYISTPEQLAGVSELMAEGVGFDGQTIRIVNDIYLNEDWGNCGNWGSKPPKNEWTPITGCFEGTFEGADFSIYGLYINNESDYQGLFGSLEGYGSIYRINVCGSYVLGKDFVGGICGAMQGRIMTCIFDGYVYGNSCVGGIIGTGSRVERCGNQGHVTGTTKVGGVIGVIEDSSGYVKKSCSQGNITGTSIVGGLIGYSGSNNLVSVAYVSGTVTGSEKTGILVGKTENEENFCWDVYIVRNEKVNTGLKDIGCNKDDIPYTEDVSKVEEVCIEDIRSGMLIDKLNCNGTHEWGMEMGVDSGPVPTNEGKRSVACIEFYTEEDFLIKVFYVNSYAKIQKKDVPEGPKKAGYTCIGWNIIGNGERVWKFDWPHGYGYSSVKFYPVYEKAPVVTQNPSGQTSESSSQTVKKKKKLKAPTFSLKKKKTKSGKRYVQIRLRKYKGKHVEIRIAEEKELRGKIFYTIFYKIKLKNSNIKKNKKVFNIKYKKQKGDFIFKIRTYKKVGKKKVYSYYSEEIRIELT